MGLFGKSFEEQVQEAVETIIGRGYGVIHLNPSIEDKIVTLNGKATSKDAKMRAMREFNELVETENTINMIRVEQAVAAAVAEPAAAPAPAQTERIYEVVRGDTLFKIAKEHYGDGNQYPKIFEANRDVLDNPNLIKVGQKLRIPELE